MGITIEEIRVGDIFIVRTEIFDFQNEKGEVIEIHPNEDLVTMHFDKPNRAGQNFGIFLPYELEPVLPTCPDWRV